MMTLPSPPASLPAGAAGARPTSAGVQGRWTPVRPLGSGRNPRRLDLLLVVAAGIEQEHVAHIVVLRAHAPNQQPRLDLVGNGEAGHLEDVLVVGPRHLDV